MDRKIICGDKPLPISEVYLPSPERRVQYVSGVSRRIFRQQQPTYVIRKKPLTSYRIRKERVPGLAICCLQDVSAIVLVSTCIFALIFGFFVWTYHCWIGIGAGMIIGLCLGSFRAWKRVQRINAMEEPYSIYMKKHE